MESRGSDRNLGDSARIGEPRYGEYVLLAAALLLAIILEFIEVDPHQ